MGYREPHRMEIEEVVRRWQGNESQRAIARATGLARETVKKYLTAAGDLGTLINPVTGRRQVVCGAPWLRARGCC
jgi:transposase